MDRSFPPDWMWSEAFALLERAERLHREVFRPVGSTARAPAWEPPVDILETEARAARHRRPARRRGRPDRGRHRRWRPGDRRHARAAARAAVGRHSPPGAAPGALRAPGEASQRHLSAAAPAGRQRLPARQAREGGGIPCLTHLRSSAATGPAATLRLRRPPMPSSSCPSAAPCCFPDWCCRSPWDGRARSPPPSRPCASSASSASCMQRNPDAADPGPADMHRVGCVANLARYVTGQDGAHHLVCQGEQRFEVLEFLDGWPFLVARVVRIPEPDSQSPEIEARFLQPPAAGPRGPAASPAGAARSARGHPVDRLAGPARRPRRRLHGPEARGEAGDPGDRRRLPRAWTRWRACSAQRIEVLRLSQEIGRQTRAALDERQREVLLREQLAAIRRELGEGEEGKAEIAELDEAIAKAQHAQGGGGAGARRSCAGWSACRRPRPSTAWCGAISTG